MPTTTTVIYLDSIEENHTPSLALNADSVLPERWNGYLRPLVSAESFVSFLDAWRSKDLNGTWGHVSEIGDTMVYVDEDSSDADTFPVAGHRDDGTALYDLSGWVWIGDAVA